MAHITLTAFFRQPCGNRSYASTTLQLGLKDKEGGTIVGYSTEYLAQVAEDLATECEGELIDWTHEQVGELYPEETD